MYAIWVYIELNLSSRNCGGQRLRSCLPERTPEYHLQRSPYTRDTDVLLDQFECNFSNICSEGDVLLTYRLNRPHRVSRWGWKNRSGSRNRSDCIALRHPRPSPNGTGLAPGPDSVCNIFFSIDANLLKEFWKTWEWPRRTFAEWLPCRRGGKCAENDFWGTV
jgi:hypothetical protein